MLFEEWPIPDADDRYTLYQVIQQIPAALRERAGVNGFGNCDYDWPGSTRVYASGRISSIADNGDGTLNITCQLPDGSGGWQSPVWIGSRHPADPPDTKFWTNYEPPDEFPYEARAYKIAIFPKDNVTTGGDPADPAYAHSLVIDDNGTDFVKVTDDGVLTLNGKALASYGGEEYRFEIIRHNGSHQSQVGFSWHMRYPPRPNCDTHVWGFVGKVVKLQVDVTPPDTFSLHVGGNLIDELAADIDAKSLENAIQHVIGGSTVSASGDAAGGFTLVFAASLVDVAVTATGATPTIPANVLGDRTQSFNDSLVGLDIVFPVGPRWRREQVTAVDGHTLTYSGSGQAAPNVYFAVIKSAGYWRPFFCAHAAFPQFHVELVNEITRSGLTPVWEFGNYWCPSEWYKSFATTPTDTHDPKTDTVVPYPLMASLITIEDCADPICDCDQYIPDGGKEDINPFDKEVHLDAQNFCTQYADRLYGAYLFWSIRGWQLAAEAEALHWVKPETWEGSKVPPNLFTPATWFKYANPSLTVTVTIDSVDAGVAQFGDIDLPQRTPLSDPIEAMSKCFFTVIDEDGAHGANGAGTLTTSTFTMDEGEFTEDDVGKTIVICYSGGNHDGDSGWSREFERRARYIYPRSWFQPDTDFLGLNVYPPVEEYPGEYITNAPTTQYAEFNRYGELEDAGGTFIDGEAARYVADSFEHPTRMKADFEDIAFQGLPSPTSNFPRWKKKGQATSGGDFWLEDANNLFWVSATPLVEHTGTGTAGSSTMQIHDSTLHRPWLTHTDETTTEFQTRLSRYWSSGGRFDGMIAECAVSGAGTMADPYVWERRPITAQNVSTDTDPYVTVQPAFSATAEGRPYKIREPGGSSRGTILNTFKGRYLIVTKKSDGSKHRVKIDFSDDHRLYWDPLEGLSVEAEDDYDIDEIEPGSVLQRKSDGENNHNGWVKTSTPDADQDDRGEDWKTDKFVGMLLNCPTIVRTFGRMRKADILTRKVHAEIYNGINALHWKKFGGAWDNFTCDDVYKCNVSSWPGDDQQLYVQDLPGCYGGSKDCRTETHFGTAWCDWGHAYNGATDNYEGCTTEDDPPGTGPVDGQAGAPGIFQAAGFDFSENCNDTDGVQHPTILVCVASEIRRQFAYFKGQVNSCWEDGVTVHCCARAMCPGGVASGTTTTTSTFTTFELKHTEHRTFETDGDPFLEGVYHEFATLDSDGEGKFCSDKIGQSGIGFHPPPPPQPTPEPHFYAFAGNPNAGAWTSGVTTGYELVDWYSLVDYKPKFQFTSAAL
jgi:hypothetical protein